MGIRVVQRAFAPPSPKLYNSTPHKIALFGTKSTPLESKKHNHSPQNKSRSVEVGLEISRLQTNNVQPDISSSRNLTPEKSILKERGESSIKDKMDIPENLEYIDTENHNDTNTDVIVENRTPSHVTFKESHSAHVVEELEDKENQNVITDGKEKRLLVRQDSENMDITSDNEVGFYKIRLSIYQHLTVSLDGVSIFTREIKLKRAFV